MNTKCNGITLNNTQIQKCEVQNTDGSIEYTVYNHETRYQDQML